MIRGPLMKNMSAAPLAQKWHSGTGLTQHQMGQTVQQIEPNKKKMFAQNFHRTVTNDAGGCGSGMMPTTTQDRSMQSVRRVCGVVCCVED
jgi:hypothetical protein